MAEKTTELRVVADRYELRSVRGRGGMGTVWEAEDRLLERRVAIKEVLLRDRGALGDEGTLRHRVLREARVAARVSHPNLVTIYDVVDGTDRVFLVQEYVDAPTLHDVVTVDGPMEPQAAARIGQQVLAALEALHEAGVVHRDVKPSNVLVLPGGGVKVADFGIALVEDDRDLTLAGSVLGSPGYLAPEQASGRRAEAAADRWALGATLWFAVEGRGPYGDTPGLAALGEVVHGPVPAASRAGALAPVLAATLRKDPMTRASAPELVKLLEAAATAPTGAPPETSALPPETLVAPVVPVAPPPPSTPPLAAPPPVKPPPPASPDPEPGWMPASPPPAAAASRQSSSTGPWLLAVVGAVLLIALVAGGLALARGGDDETAATAPTTATTVATGSAATAAAPAAPGTTARTRTTSTTAKVAAATSGTPAGWERYEDAAAGYSVAHPAGWQTRKVDGTRTDLVDPASGAYLRVDWTDKPADPLEAWQRSSKAFGASHEGYEQIRLEETTFKGFDGALWEYRYTGGGARLHASNLTFVTSPDRAYALNFQTSESRWAGDQDLRSQLEGSFELIPKKDKKPD